MRSGRRRRRRRWQQLHLRIRRRCRARSNISQHNVAIRHRRKCRWRLNHDWWSRRSVRRRCSRLALTPTRPGVWPATRNLLLRRRTWSAPTGPTTSRGVRCTQRARCRRGCRRCWFRRSSRCRLRRCSRRSRRRRLCCRLRRLPAVERLRYLLARSSHRVRSLTHLGRRATNLARCGNHLIRTRLRPRFSPCRRPRRCGCFGLTTTRHWRHGQSEHNHRDKTFIPRNHGNASHAWQFGT